MIMRLQQAPKVPSNDTGIILAIDNHYNHRDDDDDGESFRRKILQRSIWVFNKCKAEKNLLFGFCFR